MDIKDKLELAHTKMTAEYDSGVYERWTFMLDQGVNHPLQQCWVAHGRSFNVTIWDLTSYSRSIQGLTWLNRLHKLW